MKLSDRKTKELHGAPWNPESRVREKAGHMMRLLESIKKFGILDPIKILPDGTILDGHRRHAVARELQLPVVPVLLYDETEIRAEDVYGQVNYAVRQLEGVEHVEIYLANGPVPNPSQLKVIREIEGRFGRSLLGRMADGKIGTRAYLVARRFIDYSDLEDVDDSQLRRVLLWAIETQCARRLEEAMREQIEAKRLWKYINAGKAFNLAKTWILEESEI